MSKMVVPLSDRKDKCSKAAVPRRCSSRIKDLKSEQEAKRAPKNSRSNGDSAAEKKNKVSKKRKSPDTSSTPSEASPTVQLNENESVKNAHLWVTETIRKFNTHYLQFVQKEEIRRSRVEADQKLQKISKAKKAEKNDKGNSKSPDPKVKSKKAEPEGKRISKRPDLKAITKMIEAKEVLNHSNIGAISGIEVGHQFFSRAEMCVVGFHNHWLNGIYYVGSTAAKRKEYAGLKLPLAVSIVLSGQYEDDQDNYNEVVYTGQGGNDLLGNKRQIKDQVMKRGNLALKHCMEQSSPVRVVRGHKCQNSYVGKVYTYDGLYKVVHYHAEKGISGFTVFKYRLKRVEGQPALTTNQVLFTRGGVPTSVSDIRGLVCEDISGGLENIPIPVTNLVDDPPVAPTGFTYISEIKCAKGIELPSATSGCKCKGSCLDPRVCSCAKLNGSDFPYVHKDGGRLIEPKAVVFECGPACGCGPGCVNRISQKGLRYRFEVFRTPNKGWGVRSWDYIPSGATICEYIGFLMKTDQIDPAADNSYVFDIDCLQTMKGLDGRESRMGEVSLPAHINKDVEKTDGPEYCLDAGSVGNFARFINHSCQPNLFVQCVLSSHHDISLARVVLIAADNIPPLQELTYDYGYVLDSVLGPDGKIKKMACYCGASDCRQRLF